MTAAPGDDAGGVHPARIQQGTRLTITVGNVQAPSADIEVVEGTCTITGMKGPDGKPLPAQMGYYVNTSVKKGDAWLIAGGAAFPPAHLAPQGDEVAESIRRASS